MVADENAKSRAVEIEKKIDFLESLAGSVNSKPCFPLLCYLLIVFLILEKGWIFVISHWLTVNRFLRI